MFLQFINKIRKKGFSVIEVLTVCSIMMVIAGGAYHILISGSRTYTAGVGGMDLNFEAQKAFMNLGRDIRNANYALVPLPVSIERIIKPDDQDLATFHKLKLVIQKADFSVIASGPKHLEHKQQLVEYYFEKTSKENGPYRLMKKNEGDTEGTRIAKKIKFGYFKREMLEEVKGSGKNKKVIHGTGPAVIKVYLEFENPKIDDKSVTGYMVRYKTSFQIRGNRIN